MIEEWIKRLPGIGVSGKGLVTIILFVIFCWTIRECFRLKYGRDSTTDTLAKHLVLLLRTFWGERGSKDPVQTINFRIVILLVFVLVVSILMLHYPPKILSSSYPKAAGFVLLGVSIITPLAIIFSGGFVLTHRKWKDLDIGD